jgi:hypothetical protein
MDRSSFRRFASGRWSRAGSVLAACALLACILRVRTVEAQSAASASLLQQAKTAESALQVDIALDRLHALQLEHPRTPDALNGRLQLARLLALVGDLPAAMLECQALRDELPADRPERQRALEFATIVARRLWSRTRGAVAPAMEAVALRGLAGLDEPTALVPERSGAWLIVDQGKDRLYRVTADAAAPVTTVPGPQAVVEMPDGSLIVGGNSGLAAAQGSVPVPQSGTWGGKARPLRRPRSLAANSRGDVFVVDRDYDGLLRCNAGASSCTPWGAPGRLKTVKVGPSDFVCTLDERQVVRVFDDTGKLLTTIGPTVNGVKLENVVDIAVDAAYGIYLLDGDLRRIDAVALSVAADGRVGIETVRTIAIPAEGDRALRNPSAIAITGSGVLVVAGRSSPRLLRIQ